MAEPFLCEVRIFSFSFAPRGWATCDGQLLPINQNQALFALLGTTYGGNGQTNFALPNLRGRGPIHWGAGYVQGQMSGEEAHTLTISEMPQHSHTVSVVNRPGSQSSPSSNFLAAHRGGYAESGNAAMHAGAASNAGGTQTHFNMPPYLALNFCIALQGIFPSQN